MTTTEYNKIVESVKRTGLAKLHFEMMKKLYNGTLSEADHDKIKVLEEMKRGKQIIEDKKMERIKAKYRKPYRNQGTILDNAG